MPRHDRLAVCLSVLLLSAAPCVTGSPPTVVAATCQSKYVGVDTLHADTSIIVFDGRGCGQVFFAQDTLIRSISVWLQPRADSLDYRGKLYITTIDSITGWPNTGQILLLGPLVAGQFVDASHPIRFEFDLDPPFALPRRDHYFFDINEMTCLGQFSILADTTNPYPDGGAFYTGSTFCDGRGPGGPRTPHAGLDLLFQIEFCDTTTPVRGRTWGELKLRYR